MSTNFNDFIDTIHAIHDRQLLEDFLIAVTTEKERREFPQRVQIVRHLIEGMPQLKIAQELGVGIATVTRGSKELSQGRFKVLK